MLSRQQSLPKGNGVGDVWSGMLLEAFGGLAAAVSERGVIWKHSLYLLFS